MMLKLDRWLPLALVLGTVVLNVLSAVILTETASLATQDWWLVAVVLMLIIFLNLARLGLWSAIHRRFALSQSYPLTALFFPVILLVGVLYGESIGWNEAAGAALITLGVVVLATGETGEGNSG